ncbi:hypothetical protein EC991_000375, partial [Linnemannia zychae]
MEQVPSNNIQLTASEVCAEDPVMSDKFAQNQIEQMVVNVLNELGQYIAKMDAANEDGDGDEGQEYGDGEEDQEEVKREDIKADE